MATLRNEGEQIYTDPVTGGMKGVKPAQLGLVDPVALDILGQVAGYGAGKYESWNYLQGYLWSLTESAGHRHRAAFWAGQDLDPESGLPHPAHEAWHALAKLSFWARGIGTDDRPPKGELWTP